MGGAPCSFFLDLYLDHYEYDWALRVARLATLEPLQAAALASAMEHFYRYADDTMGLVPCWFLDLLSPECPRDPTTTDWIYPLRDTDGKKTIMEFEIENALTWSIHFLCMTITIEPSPHSVHAPNWIHLTPYNKKSEFNFPYPRFTHWHSRTAIAVKLSVYKSMLQYALLCSTSTKAITAYLEDLTRALCNNRFPFLSVVHMWEDAAETLHGIPTKDYIAVDLENIYHHIHSYIRIIWRQTKTIRKRKR
jgi:hypothetical protein